MLSKVNPNISPDGQVIRRVALLENQYRNMDAVISGSFLLGRLRTDRTPPLTSSDVQTPDTLYDRVLTPTYEYILIENSGSLSWRRVTLSTF